MWGIYDDLISAVSDDSVVSDCLVGLGWTLVRSDGVGVAYASAHSSERMVGKIIGQKTERLAEYVKSWDGFESCVGMAAINSVLNTVERVEAITGRPIAAEKSSSVFDLFAEKVRGKKVAVVGHFPALEPLGQICQMSILERNPRENDLPDPAAEYILSEQHYVFITAVTLINKTLPRLLELSKNARVVMVGPSTPLTPILFDYGIDVLAGTVIADENAAWTAVKEGGHRAIFANGGRMVRISREREDQL